MPYLITPVSVQAFVPNFGLSGTVYLGTLGGGGEHGAVYPLTRIVSSTQSGYHEYVVATNDQNNATWNISHINEIQSNGLSSNSSTGDYNGNITWDIFYYTGVNTAPTGGAIPIDIIADARTTVSSTIYTYDTSGHVYRCVGFSSSAVWTNITPAALTATSVMPIASTYSISNSGYINTIPALPPYVNTLSCDSSGSLYALYYRPVTPSTSGYVLNVQRWTGIGTTWVDITSGVSLVEGFTMASNTAVGTVCGAFSSVSGSVVLSSPLLKTIGATSGTQWVIYLSTSSTSGAWVNYLTTYGGYGIATAVNTNGFQEEYTMQSSATTSTQITKFGIVGVLYTGTIIVSAASGDIYNIGGVSAEPTNALTVTLFPSRSPT